MECRRMSVTGVVGDHVRERSELVIGKYFNRFAYRTVKAHLSLATVWRMAATARLRCDIFYLCTVVIRMGILFIFYVVA